MFAHIHSCFCDCVVYSCIGLSAHAHVRLQVCECVQRSAQACLLGGCSSCFDGIADRVAMVPCRVFFVDPVRFLSFFLSAGPFFVLLFLLSPCWPV